MKIIGSDKGIHSPEFHKKKTREQGFKQILWGLLLVIIIAIPIYLARTSRFLITSIEVTGNNVTKSEDIERLAAEDLSGNYAWIFPRSNTGIYPKQRIERDLLNTIPRLASVDITRVGAKGLRIAVKERAPVAEYCTKTVDASNPEDCYFIDDTGYIFSPAPAFSGNVYLTYTNDTPFESPIGKQVLPQEEFDKTLSFVKSLGSLGIYPRVFLIKMDEYHVLLTNNTDIMLGRSADLNEAKNNLSAFLTQDSILKEKDFLNRVLYIDLRFGNKIFYKFRDEAASATLTQ
jgi:cell division septal protein FtsQ